MKKILIYEFLILFFISTLFICHHLAQMPDWYISNLLLIHCGLIGSLGGVLYCLRSIYINKCVHKRWDNVWHIWYYLRPITSGICGFISFVFLKAGLLVLDVPSTEGNTYGYLALSFLAGYSVDSFMKKLEMIMRSVWNSGKEESNEEES